MRGNIKALFLYSQQAILLNRYGMMTAIPSSKSEPTMQMRHEAAKLSLNKAIVVFIYTVIMLGLSVLFTNNFVKLRLW